MNENKKGPIHLRFPQNPVTRGGGGRSGLHPGKF